MHTVPGTGSTSPKGMDALLPLMSMVLYSIDKIRKFRLNKEVRSDFQPPRHTVLRVCLCAVCLFGVLLSVCV